MITITTKQFPPTGLKPARIRAEWRGRGKYFYFDPMLSDYENHLMAAQNLMSSLQKVPVRFGDYWVGALPNGWTFSVDPDGMKRVAA